MAAARLKADVTATQMERRRRLLVISLYYWPEITGNGPIVTELTRMLQCRGFEITVLAGTPHYRLETVPSRYRNRLYVKELVAGVRVVRCYAYSNARGKLGKVVNYVTFLATAVPAALLSRKPSVVVVVSPPFFLGLAGVLTKYLRGARFLYNAQDLFPEAYIRSGILKKGWLTRILRIAQKWIYEWADVVSVITPSFKERVRSEGIPSSKIRVISNFVDEQHVRPLPRRNNFSHQHDLAERFVALYAGNIGHTHGAEILVDVARILEKNREVLIVVVGDGSRRKRLLEAAEKAGVINMRFLLPQPLEVLPEMLAASDVGIVTTQAGIAHTSFPSRIYGLMAAERPMVVSVDTDSDAAELVRSSRCGLVVPPNRPDLLAGAVQELWSSPQERAEMGRLGREYLLQHYAKGLIADQYQLLLHELCP